MGASKASRYSVTTTTSMFIRLLAKTVTLGQSDTSFLKTPMLYRLVVVTYIYIVFINNIVSLMSRCYTTLGFIGYSLVTLTLF
jgi:hypothetical protein